MMEIFFKSLDQAAHRLNLSPEEVDELGEAALHAWGNGQSEMEAVRMTLSEFLQRRGLYDGLLKQMVDDGTIFQMAEGGNKSSERCRESSRIRRFPGPWRQTDREETQSTAPEF